MFLPEQLPGLRRQIRAQAERDYGILGDLVAQARAMAPGVRPIRPRSATSVALTAADGGNNAVAFNPFSLQIVRIVDSQGKELFLDVVSPTTDIEELSRAQFAGGTALGRLMTDLGVGSLRDLSPMLAGRSPLWVRTYRELCEWAVLYDLVCDHQFATDTLIVRDGLLRSTRVRRRLADPDGQADARRDRPGGARASPAGMAVRARQAQRGARQVPARPVA